MDGQWYGDVSLLGYASSGMMQLSNAYIGVVFLIGENIHYGWIHYVGFSVGEDPIFFMSWDRPGGWIDSWAYNSIPGEPIYAGQIPEPSAALLAGIAALAAAAFVRRRKS